MNFIFKKSILATFYAFAVALLLAACVKDLDFPTAFQKQVVVVGVLNPDSLIALRLSYSQPPNSSSKYQTIDKAEVSFYENNQLIGKLSNAKNGFYALTRRPSIGKQYGIKIKVEGFEELAAADSIPSKPALQLSRYDATTNPNQNPDMVLRVFNAPALRKASIWFNVYAKTEAYTFLQEISASGTNIPIGEEDKYIKWTYGFRGLNVLSNSPYLDRFNSVFDGLDGKYSFGDPVRIDTELIRLDAKPSIDFIFFNQIIPKYRNTAFLYAFTASETYNRYLKSAITAYQNRLLDSNGNLSNPFAEPTPVYTNVKNGLGIWAAYSGVRITF